MVSEFTGVHISYLGFGFIIISILVMLVGVLYYPLLFFGIVLLGLCLLVWLLAPVLM